MSLTTALTQMPKSPEAAPRQPTRIGSTGQHEALIFASVFAASAAVLLVFDRRLRFDLGDDAYIHLRIAQNLIRTGHYALAWFHVRPLGGVHKATALLPRVTVIAALSNSSPGLAESGQSFRSLGE